MYKLRHSATGLSLTGHLIRSKQIKDALSELNVEVHIICESSAHRHVKRAHCKPPRLQPAWSADTQTMTTAKLRHETPARNQTVES